MKSISFVLLLITTSLASFSQAKITSEEASKHIGDSVVLIDKVYDGKHLDNGITVLNLGNTSPEQLVSVVIKPEDRLKFPFKPEERLQGKRVLVKGKVTANKGRPEIIVSGPEQLRELIDSDAHPGGKIISIDK
jgi:DNA/RNA endonuclease YhcR with UshA esterase domain